MAFLGGKIFVPDSRSTKNQNAETRKLFLVLHCWYRASLSALARLEGVGVPILSGRAIRHRYLTECELSALIAAGQGPYQLNVVRVVTFTLERRTVNL